MAATVPGEEHDFAAGESSGEQMIGRIAKRCLDADPFLIGKTLDMIQPAAANDPNPMIRHARFIATRPGARRDLVLIFYPRNGEGDPETGSP